jgi:1-aminocyclopropane-1-carboxylate deaminase/D-cysteine desulfhydrase-like pyridoxal-dependent ACC family enzyme
MSAIQKFSFGKRLTYVKRDDLMNTLYPGNKFRKLFSVIHQLQQPNHNKKQVISFGGRQSNHMLAVAHLAKEFGLKYLYYTPPSSNASQSHTAGNLYESLNLGMNLIEDSRDFLTILKELPKDNESIIIPQGGKGEFAEIGIQILAKEIENDIATLNLSKPVSVILPSGTGTTSFFLAKHLSHNNQITVYTNSVVMAKNSFETELNKMKNLYGSDQLPIIIETKEKYKFAEPSKELFNLYCYLKQHFIEFDLIYAPPTWKAILENWQTFKDTEILYIHTGGVSGNVTQKSRYNLSPSASCNS